ncbi:MAG: carboxypeptidase-like regulatory domain-containing protein [Pseudomonadota bacterium]
MTVGSVQGQVVRADGGAPVAQAVIAVLDGPGPYPDIAIMSDRDGRFSLADLPAGKWRISARAADGASGDTSVEVSNGAVAHALVQVR